VVAINASMLKVK